MDKLKLYRNQLDLLDDKIMKLLEERFEVIAMIKDHKQTSNLPVYDQGREQEIFLKTKAFTYQQQILNIYHQILTESKLVQRS